MTDADYANMSAFSCGVEKLDHFFKREIKECVEKRYLSAYCAFTESDEILAVFTLMNDAIMVGGENERADFFEDLLLEQETDIVDFLNISHHILQLTSVTWEHP